MKRYLKISVVVLLMLTLMLTACGGKSSEKEEENEAPKVIETEQDTQAPETKPAIDDEKVDNDKDDTGNEATESESEEEAEAEAEIEVGLFDRALLESIKYNWPDSLMMVTKEEDNDGVTIITTYQKGYSTREESVSEGVTKIEIYNEELGITYDYTLGETTGFAYKDDEEDKLLLEEAKAMVGQSFMSLFEEDMWADMKILADRDTVLGRKAIMIEMINPDAEVASEGTMKFWFDAKYTVPLKMVWSFGEDWNLVSEVTEIDFNPRLKDELFEAPEDVTFMDY